MVIDMTEFDDGPRSKRSRILHTAVAHFGEHGFEATKWSAIADQVGIGQTALYHYFESKSHCLLLIMRLELQRSLDRFIEATSEVEEADVALRAALRAIFALSPEETLQLRILRNYQALLAQPRRSRREEEERIAARELTYQNEVAWQALLERGMDQGVFPRRDPRLLTLTVVTHILGIWQWYRVDGAIALDDLRDFVSDSVWRIVALE